MTTALNRDEFGNYFRNHDKILTFKDISIWNRSTKNWTKCFSEINLNQVKDKIQYPMDTRIDIQSNRPSKVRSTKDKWINSMTCLSPQSPPAQLKVGIDQIIPRQKIVHQNPSLLLGQESNVEWTSDGDMSVSSSINNKNEINLLSPNGTNMFENKEKRKRTVTTPYQTRVLRKMLAQSAFPSTEMRENLARALGMTPRTVQIWFQNQRQKAKHKSIVEKHPSISMDNHDHSKMLESTMEDWSNEILIDSPHSLPLHDFTFHKDETLDKKENESFHLKTLETDPSNDEWTSSQEFIHDNLIIDSLIPPDKIKLYQHINGFNDAYKSWMDKSKSFQKTRNENSPTLSPIDTIISNPTSITIKKPHITNYPLSHTKDAFLNSPCITSTPTTSFDTIGMSMDLANSMTYQSQSIVTPPSPCSSKSDDASFTNDREDHSNQTFPIKDMEIIEKNYNIKDQCQTVSNDEYPNMTITSLPNSPRSLTIFESNRRHSQETFQPSPSSSTSSHHSSISQFRRTLDLLVDAALDQNFRMKRSFSDDDISTKTILKAHERPMMNKRKKNS